MSKIEDLIKQYCPNGCEWKGLGEVANISTGLNPRKNFILNTCDADKYYVTVKEITSGEIKFADNTDKINSDAWGIIQKRSKVQQGSVLLSGIGTIGKVAVVTDSNSNWNCSESVYVINPNLLELNSYFLKYYLESSQIQYLMHRKSQGGTLKGIRQGDLKQFLIPVPPLPVQEEIVRILDEFTELEKELEKELEMRKKQYGWYRDELLTFGDDVERKRLGDKSLFNFRYGTGNNIPVDTGGKYDVYGSNGIVSHINDYNCEDVSIIGHIGAYAGIVNRCRGKCFVTYNGTIASVVDTTRVDSQYFHHVLNELNLQSMKKGSQPFLSVSDFSHLQIPVPSLQEQQRIVEILDTFDTLTTDLIKGLPAEIKMRHQQYEYYRDYLFGLLK